MSRSSLIDAQEPLQEKASMYVPCTSGQTDAKAGSPELPVSLPILCHLFLLLDFRGSAYPLELYILLHWEGM